MAPMAVARTVARVIAVVMVVLGVLLWTGRADGIRPFHIAIGLALVIDLWVASALAARGGAPRALVAVALAWSLFMPVFGLTQESVLAGGGHVAVQVVHLLVGLAAVGLIEALSRAIASRTPAPA